MKRGVSIIALILITTLGFSQRIGHFYSVTEGFGKMIPNHPELSPLKSTYLVTDIRWGVHTNGDSYWEQAYNNPVYGFGANFGSYQNVNLGKIMAVYSFIDFPIARRGPVTLRSDFAAGLSYFNNPYDPIKNPVNEAVSTHVLVKLSVGGQLSWNISKYWAANLWAGVDHYSNGSTTKPNAGLNSVLIKTGVIYSLHDEVKITDPLPLPDLDRKSIVVYGATATYQTSENSPRYQAAVAQITYNYRMNYKHKIGIGLDYCYDPSSYHGENTFFGRSESAVVLSHELALDRFSFVTQFCYNFYHQHGRPSYERVALRYWSNDRLFLSAGLKTRWASSIFVEFGIGYSLGWGKVSKEVEVD